MLYISSKFELKSDGARTWYGLTGMRVDIAAQRLRWLWKSGFDPNQPRVPEGNPDGGEWTDSGGGGGGAGAGNAGTGRHRPRGDGPRQLPITAIYRPISKKEADQLERRLGYQDDGPSENEHAIRNLVSVGIASQDAAQARTDSKVRVTAPTGDPNQDGHNDTRDAFRHADWSLRMTRNLGSAKAKEFGDAHERSEPGQPRGERLMDLINNHIGRSLAAKPGLPPDIVDEALKKGLLQTRPVEIR